MSHQVTFLKVIVGRLVTHETAIEIHAIHSDKGIYVWPSVTRISALGNPNLRTVIVITGKVDGHLQVRQSVGPAVTAEIATRIGSIHINGVVSVRHQEIIISRVTLKGTDVNTSILDTLAFETVEVMSQRVLHTLTVVCKDRTISKMPVSTFIVGTDIRSRSDEVRRINAATVVIGRQCDSTDTGATSLDSAVTQINRHIGTAHCHLLRVEVSTVAPKHTVDEFVIGTTVLAIDTTSLVIRIVIHHGTVEQLARNRRISDIHTTTLGFVGQSTVVINQAVVDCGVLSIDGTAVTGSARGCVVAQVVVQAAIGQLRRLDVCTTAIVQGSVTIEVAIAQLATVFEVGTRTIATLVVLDHAVLDSDVVLGIDTTTIAGRVTVLDIETVNIAASCGTKL